MKPISTVIVLTMLIFLGTACDPPQQNTDQAGHYETPRLVVGIMVDQMRYDYFYRYWDKYGDDGIKRLINEGFSFDNAHFDYMPTYTGPGHASVYTAAVHGIIGNNWYVREEGRSTYVTEDPNYQTVGSGTDAGEISPRWMLSSTISDELRLQTNMRSKVVGISLKDRGSILPAGHTGDAYWFDYDTGDFITSTYYYDELPGWVQDFNNRNLVDEYLSEPWQTLLPIGHQYGPTAIEVQDTYLRLDRLLARLFNHLDEEFGMENVLIFLTSDHGAGHVPAYLQDLGIPAGNFVNSDAEDTLRDFLDNEYGEDLLTSFSNQQVFLDRDRIAEAGEDLKAVQERVARFMLGIDGVAGALSAHSLHFNQFTDGLAWKVQRGFNQKRSGDVITWLEPQWMPHGSTGTTHGSPFSYDTRAPMVWYGWDIPSGRTTHPVYISDIASTLAVFLNTAYPSGNTGNPMNHYMKR